MPITRNLLSNHKSAFANHLLRDRTPIQTIPEASYQVTGGNSIPKLARYTILNFHRQKLVLNLIRWSSNLVNFWLQPLISVTFILRPFVNQVHPYVSHIKTFIFLNYSL